MGPNLVGRFNLTGQIIGIDEFSDVAVMRENVWGGRFPIVWPQLQKRSDCLLDFGFISAAEAIERKGQQLVIKIRNGNPFRYQPFRNLWCWPQDA